jgi:FkbM family methyltransferase
MEIGVGSWDMSRAKYFLNNEDCKVTLIEPNKNFYNTLNKHRNEHKNLEIKNLAIGDSVTCLKFYDYGQESYLEGVIPPLSKFGPAPTDNAAPVNVVTMKEIDDGAIDILLADVEGSEWFILKNLISRPRIIALETHCEAEYTNPNIEKIWDWMNKNTYKVLFKNTTDSFYIRGDDYGWGKGGNTNWRC